METGGSRLWIELYPTTRAEMIIPPTSRSLLFLLKNKLSERKTACVILVLLVTLGSALNKLLGSLTEAVACVVVLSSNDRSLESILPFMLRFEKSPRLALKFWPNSMNWSRSTCCTESANVLRVITTGSEIFPTGISPTIDPIASSILLEDNKC